MSRYVRIHTGTARFPNHKGHGTSADVFNWSATTFWWLWHQFPACWFLITLWCFDTCINLRTNQWSHLCLIHRLLDAQIMFWSGVLPLADASIWTSHQYTGGWFLITSINSLILLWHKLQFTSLVFFKQLYHDAEWISVIMIQFRFLNSVHSVISYASP